MTDINFTSQWFEKGFRIRRQKIARGVNVQLFRDNKRHRSGALPARRGAVVFSKGAQARNFRQVIKKSPEVMVKITGSSKSFGSIKRHIEYISRNGEVALTNESGQVIHGSLELKNLKQNYKAITPEQSNKREYLHVMFSMPPGTPKEIIQKAVAEFASEEFSNRIYVMATHNDTKQTHVHLAVSTRDIHRADEARLSPRKADLMRWRQGFADKLNELGVDAAASYRNYRFNYRKAEHATVRQIRADNPSSSVYNADRAIARQDKRIKNAQDNPKTAFVGAYRPPRTPNVYRALNNELLGAMSTKQRPENPYQKQIETNRKNTVNEWEKIADALDGYGDVALAKQVRELITSGNKRVVSRNQELYDKILAGQDKIQSF